MFKERLSDYGLNFNFEKGFFTIYLQCAAIMLPLFIGCDDGELAERYPYLRVYNGEPYMGRRCSLGNCFISSSFRARIFFRGFIIHSLKPAIGIYDTGDDGAVLYDTFGKPMPESFRR